jgi:hypothetical protein
LQQLTLTADSARVFYLGDPVFNDRGLFVADVQPLFADGFENGTTSAWSGSTEAAGAEKLSGVEVDQRCYDLGLLELRERRIERQTQ